MVRKVHYIKTMTKTSDYEAIKANIKLTEMVTGPSYVGLRNLFFLCSRALEDEKF